MYPSQTLTFVFLLGALAQVIYCFPFFAHRDATLNLPLSACSLDFSTKTLRGACFLFSPIDPAAKERYNEIDLNRCFGNANGDLVYQFE
jgi:hypothetical protein